MTDQKTTVIYIYIYLYGLQCTVYNTDYFYYYFSATEIILFCIDPVLMISLSLCISVILYFLSNLLSNPYVCDCHLAWLGQWLKKTRVVSGNPRCQKPAFLKEIPIQDVATPDFTCDGEPLSHSALMFCFCCSFWL